MIEEVIQRRKEFLKNRSTSTKKFHLQPTIMTVGPDEKPAFMVVFDNIKYSCESIGDAIASVIVITFVLDLDYNADAEFAWIFIQQYLFGIAPKK